MKTRDVKFKPRKKALRFVIFGLASFALIIYFFSLVANVSFDIANKYKEKEELTKQLEELKEKEQELNTDVEKLQDPEYIGRYLREKFLYSKPDEYIIRIPDNK